MRRYFRWGLVAILFITFFTTLGSSHAQAAPVHRVSANIPRTSNGVFPPCGPLNDGEVILVGGNRYVCGCVRVTQTDKQTGKCSWVWRNLDAVAYTSLELDQGVLISNGPKATLYFQPDNNLVVYDEFGLARWASNTVGKANKVLFQQADGNFVAYDSAGHATWASNTCCWSGSTLQVQTDGNVVIYNFLGIPLWATNTNH